MDEVWVLAISGYSGWSRSQMKGREFMRPLEKPDSADAVSSNNDIGRGGHALKRRIATMREKASGTG
jgi:hypothetical protein